MIEKPSLPSESPLTAFPHFVFGDFATLFPCTAAYWGASVWPDGSAKKPARVSFWMDAGKLFVQFQLVGTGLRLRAEIPDPVMVWDALEALLSRVPVPWQVDPYLPAESSDKGKKGGKKGS